MLISLTVQNWMSFRDAVHFSMIASRDRKHGERVPRVRKYPLRILPIAVLYGGNASGKTNFFRALHFARNLVVEGTKPDSLIPGVQPFLLDDESANEPSRFIFEILSRECMYEFDFTVNRESVLAEKLIEIRSSGEKTLYDRRAGKPHFHPALARNRFLQFAFQGTRGNQLLLTNATSQKVNTFRPVFDWFRDLRMVAPDARFGPVERFRDEDARLHRKMNELLPRLDMGINRLGRERIAPELLRFPAQLQSQREQDRKEGAAAHIPGDTDDILGLLRDAGQRAAYKLVTYHSKNDGTETPFDLAQETDGAKRVIHLLPALLELAAPDSKKVCAIDEFARSLHPLLAWTLLQLFLDQCSHASRAQLLLTTHDTQLMDRRIWRRDEIWMAERDPAGHSRLFSVSEYQEERAHPDVRKNYLEGRMGGIPNTLLADW